MTPAPPPCTMPNIGPVPWDNDNIDISGSEDSSHRHRNQGIQLKNCHKGIFAFAVIFSFFSGFQ